jgi:hypothetical protein
MMTLKGAVKQRTTDVLRDDWGFQKCYWFYPCDYNRKSCMEGSGETGYKIAVTGYKLKRYEEVALAFQGHFVLLDVLPEWASQG